MWTFDDPYEYRGGPSSWTVTPCDPPSPEKYRQLPKNAAQLKWARCVQHPCYCGDDLYIAVDPEKGLAFSTFDGCTANRKFQGTLKEWAEMNCCREEEMTGTWDNIIQE